VDIVASVDVQVAGLESQVIAASDLRERLQRLTAPERERSATPPPSGGAAGPSDVPAQRRHVMEERFLRRELVVWLKEKLCELTVESIDESNASQQEAPRVEIGCEWPQCAAWRSWELVVFDQRSCGAASADDVSSYRTRVNTCKCCGNVWNKTLWHKPNPLSFAWNLKSSRWQSVSCFVIQNDGVKWVSAHDGKTFWWGFPTAGSPAAPQQRACRKSCTLKRDPCMAASMQLSSSSKWETYNTQAWFELKAEEDTIALFRAPSHAEAVAIVDCVREMHRACADDARRCRRADPLVAPEATLAWETSAVEPPSPPGAASGGGGGSAPFSGSK
jgi:hypothetical protein